MRSLIRWRGTFGLVHTVEPLSDFPEKIDSTSLAGGQHLLVSLLRFCLRVKVNAGEQNASKVLYALKLKQPAFRASFKVDYGVGKQEFANDTLGQKWNFCCWHITTQIARIRRCVEEKYLHK